MKSFTHFFLLPVFAIVSMLTGITSANAKAAEFSVTPPSVFYEQGGRRVSPKWIPGGYITVTEPDEDGFTRLAWKDWPWVNVFGGRSVAVYAKPLTETEFTTIFRSSTNVGILPGDHQMKRLAWAERKAIIDGVKKTLREAPGYPESWFYSYVFQTECDEYWLVDYADVWDNDVYGALKGEKVFDVFTALRETQEDLKYRRLKQIQRPDQDDPHGTWQDAITSLFPLAPVLPLVKNLKAKYVHPQK